VAEPDPFSCSNCKAAHAVSDNFAALYAGRKVTRWCENCKTLFDLELPPGILPGR